LSQAEDAARPPLRSGGPPDGPGDPDRLDGPGGDGSGGVGSGHEGPEDPGGQGPGGGGAGRREHRGGGALAALREGVVVVVAALLLSLLVKTFLAQAFYIPSESMQQTLEPGDRVVVSLLTPGPFDLERGDVVVFDDRGSWLPPALEPERGPVAGVVVRVLEFVGILPQSTGGHLIKRVIGLPGDRVVCCDEQGRLSVNGASVDESYLYPGDAPSEYPEGGFEVQVPDGRLWVMGDHRSASQDSRFHTGEPGGGAVPVDGVVGRAVVTVWPLPRWAWLGGQDDVFAGVPAPAP
jgi:signal peptidase I